MPGPERQQSVYGRGHTAGFLTTVLSPKALMEKQGVLLCYCRHCFQGSG